ncbi:MAG TPA: molybdopterin-binding protein, partial [Kineosporiaceae bacterium]|nr:molybdopterin-binding protein [Kineosporiaceae bacterium]
MQAEGPPPQPDERSHVPDTADALASALSDSMEDAVVTTGSTAHGPADHLRDVLKLPSGLRIAAGDDCSGPRATSGLGPVGVPKDRGILRGIGSGVRPGRGVLREYWGVRSVLL